MNKIFIHLLLACGLGTGANALAAQAASTVTLDQAVSQVQSDTGGRVLSAEPRHFGRRSEYRIKVLTPSGHVRVVVVPANARKNAPAAQSTKNPSRRHAGSKEKR